MKTSLIEQEGKFYKECSLIMLETTKENFDKYLVINKQGALCMWNIHEMGTQLTLPNQHLYITSDDEIKKGDWFISHSNEILQCIEIEGNVIYDKNNFPSFTKTKYGLRQESKAGKNGPETFILSKKIIASTDLSLSSKGDFEKKFRDKEDLSFDAVILPSPSDKFIQAFVESYNQANPIEKVLVEYEQSKECDCHYFRDCKSYTLNETLHCPKGEPKHFPKLKDSNIIIKKMKNSWSRDEVRQLCWQAFTSHYPKMSPDDIDTIVIPKFEEWLKNNL